MLGKRTFVFVTTVLIVCTCGCKKDSTGPEHNTPEDDIADIVAAAFGDINHTDGVAAQISEFAHVARGDSLAKRSEMGSDIGSLVDTTINILRRQTTGDFTYSFNFQYQYELAPRRDSLHFGYNASGVYNAPHMSGGDTSLGSFDGSQLLSGSAYSITGTYAMFGNQTSKLGNNDRLESYIAVTFSSLRVSRQTTLIVGGAATLDLTVAINGAESVDYEATMTFQGNQAAKFAINGRTYVIDLARGEATLVSS